MTTCKIAPRFDDLHSCEPIDPPLESQSARTVLRDVLAQQGRFDMPRYRFAWSNLPPKLLKRLGADLALDGEPADALWRHFGARPKPAFVQEAWPTLVEVWLPSDAAGRLSVAEELRALGLGRTEISIGSKQGQLDYLRSCRNAPTLRDVVLAAFLVAGETTQLETPIARPEPSGQDAPRERQRDSQRDTASARPDAQGRSDEQDTVSLDLERHSRDFDDSIIDTLKEAYDLPELFRNPDGDIPLPRGSSILYIRSHERGSPFLEIFSQLVRDFRMSPEVYEAVNDINAQIRMAKAVVAGDGTVIVLSLELLTDTISVRELLFSIDLLSSAADHFDTLLQKRFGGETQLTEDDDDSIDV